MAIDLSGTTALTEKTQSWYRIVYLVEIDADEPDVGESTQYLATRSYTVSGQAYSDALAPEGLSFDWERLQVGGGLAEVASARIEENNLEKASNLGDTYFLDNDEVREYVIFVTGAETAADKIEIYRGVVENDPYNVSEWGIEVIDGSDRDFREIPAQIIDLITYPDAPLDAAGRVIPVVFGALNTGPADGAGAYPLLAPCRCLNYYTQQYTSGLQNDVYGTVYQSYGSAQRVAEVLSVTQTGGTFTIDDTTRLLILRPAIPKATNTVVGWKAAADGNTSVGVDIVNLDNLDLYFSGVSKLGTLTDVDIQITADAAFDWAVYLGVTLLDSGSGGIADIDLSGALSNWAEDWDFQALSIEINGTTNCEISEIYLRLYYSDQLMSDRRSMDIFQKVTGWEDLATYYRDGAVISSSGTPLTNPAHQLAAIFRSKVLLNRLAAEVNTADVTATASDRSTWTPAFVLDQPINIEWLNEFGRQMGLHFWKGYQGKWKMVAQTKTRIPTHTFLESYGIAVVDPDVAINEWRPDISFSKTPKRDLINEILLRYRLDRTSGEFTAQYIASGRYRVTGTCSVAGGATGTLTDGTADFTASGVQVNDRIYIVGYQDYTVTVVGTTTLTITADSGNVETIAAGTTYYVGPNLDGRLVRSQLRYKSENPLGRRQSNFRDDGGYTSELITDATTASNFVEHIIEWRSQRRLTVELGTHLNAVDVEKGDAAWVDFSWLYPTKRPVSIGTLTANINSAVTTITSAENGLLRVNDYLLIDSEVMAVSAVSYGTQDITVSRGQSNTVAASHTLGATISLLNRTKWEVTGKKHDPDRAQIRLELQEMPPSYEPIGRASDNAYDTYSTMSPSERVLSGFATFTSERAAEEDEFSNISYVGPDS